MAHISLQNIYKIYPGSTNPVVSDFNLEVQEREFIVFVGPSGCGKSTTLRMIAGLEPITSGKLFIGGELMNEVAPGKRTLSMVFQSYALYPHMTVKQNIEFPLLTKKPLTETQKKLLDCEKEYEKQKDILYLKHEEVYNQFKEKKVGKDALTESKISTRSKLDKLRQEHQEKIFLIKDGDIVKQKKRSLSNKDFQIWHKEYKNAPKKEREERILEVAKIVGLEEYLDRRPRTLSGGQRQRVAVARAIVKKDTKVLLMDEPLSNLDAKLRIQMRAELIKLHEDIKQTIIYVTHDQVEAMTMATRLVIMKDGFIQQIGTPKEVFDTPENIFVASFIGTPPMNFINGVVKNGIFSNNDIKLQLPETIKNKFPKEYLGKPVILGIRPENIKLVNLKADNVLKTKIELAELLGSEYHLLVKLSEANIIAKTSSTQVLHTGDYVNLKFELTNVHFFDPETTRRIQLI